MIQPDGGEQGIDSQVVNVGDRVSMECIVTGKNYILASCEIALLKAFVQNYTLNTHADLFRFCLNFHLILLPYSVYVSREGSGKII